MYAMSKIWARRIIGGTQFYDKCPEKYKGEVLELMKIEVQKKKLTAEKFEELTGEKYAE